MTNILNFKFSRKKLRDDNNYTSCKVLLPDPLSDDESDNDKNNDNDNEDSQQIKYVVGDLTQPMVTGRKDRIIVHCVGKNDLLFIKSRVGT